MIADSGLPIPHIRREKGPAGRAKRVIEPQRFRHIRQPVARNGPVGNVIVNLFRTHVVNILRVVDPSFGLAGTNELVRLENDAADAARIPLGSASAGQNTASKTDAEREVERLRKELNTLKLKEVERQQSEFGEKE